MDLRFVTKVKFKIQVQDKYNKYVKCISFRVGDDVRLRRFGTFYYDYAKCEYVDKSEHLLWADGRKSVHGIFINQKDLTKVRGELIKARKKSKEITKAEEAAREAAARRPATPKERFERTFSEIDA